MRSASAVALTVLLSDEQLDDLAARIARKLLASTPGDTYDQDAPPPGMTRRTYLDAARGGRFPTRKVGRKVVALRADVDAWRASLPSAETPAGRGDAPEPGNDTELDPEVARLVARNRGPV